jgi:hypothetical protein
MTVLTGLAGVCARAVAACACAAIGKKAQRSARVTTLLDIVLYLTVVKSCSAITWHDGNDPTCSGVHISELESQRNIPGWIEENV